jgi:ribonucleoside-diphosphate reductase alpha chain
MIKDAGPQGLEIQHIAPDFKPEIAPRTITLPAGGEVTVDAPTGWSDQAVRICAAKYLIKNPEGEIVESIPEMIDRVVQAITAAGEKGGYFEESEDADAFADNLSYILFTQKASFNSPVWFNVGRSEDPQASACFILSVEDSMESILDWYRDEGMIFKGGSGAGTNLSKIRGSKEPLSRGGIASGPLSFMRGADASAGAIKSGGTTRRAAKMVVLDDDHPDIEEFVGCKVVGEEVADALTAAGFSQDFTDEKGAYALAPYQNANNSVRVSDAFMEAVSDDGAWFLNPRTAHGRPEPTTARGLMDQIAKAAWRCGDPGIQFKDTINKWHTVPADGPINASNPCQPAHATVLTPDGIRTFADINVGSTIWSGKRWTRVIRKVATGKKPVFTYQTTAGAFLGTENHRIIQGGKRVEVKDADGIDIATGPAPEGGEIALQDVVDGWTLGDGTYHKAWGRIYLNVGSEDLDPARRELQEFLGDSLAVNKYAYAVATTLEPEDLPHTYARKIPQAFLHADSGSMRGFLRGLYAANGSVCGNRVTLKATSFDVITGVQQMLSALGIRSYYTTNKEKSVDFKNGEYTCKRNYDLNIGADRGKFAELIGFVHPHKSEKLAEACKLNGKTRKHTYEIHSREYVGDLPVWDIEVEDEDHTYWTGGLLVSNCSEFVFLDNTACNLASINLKKVNEVSEVQHVTETLIIAQEILVGLAGYPTEMIAYNSRRFRPLGLGITNLGGLLMSAGIPYDSHRGREQAAGIMAVIHARAYLTSWMLARVKGPFAGFADNRAHTNRVIDMHMEHAKGDHASAEWAGFLFKKAVADFEAVPRSGVRNAQVTVIAPTGTISFMMDCDTTGCEPVLALSYRKALVGGGHMDLLCESMREGLGALGYSEREIEKIEAGDYAMIAPEHREVFQTSFGGPCGALSWRAHVDMMAVLQPYLSGAISKTVNLPNDATPEDIRKVYEYAWTGGIKAIAVYRDGCKGSQPLTSTGPEQSPEQTQGSEEQTQGWDLDNYRKDPVIMESFAPQRARLPDTRASVTHRFAIAGQRGYLTVGLYEDGRFGEIFLRMAREGSTLSGLLDAWAKSVSMLLQCGVPVSEIRRAFEGTRYEPAGFTQSEDVRNATSITDYVVRWLDAKEAAARGEDPRPEIAPTSGEICRACGSADMVKAGSCYTCRTCGETTGCG